MSILNLQSLLNPRSVALIGASDKPNSLGRRVLENLLNGKFAGPVWPVNPKYSTICQQPVFAGVEALPAAPDLALIATPAATIPQLILDLGEKGTRGVVVLSSGTDQLHPCGRTIDQLMLEAAQPFGLRILGPNCVGLLLPNIGLNASFAHTDSLPGRLALISQSGALCTTLLDWAKSRGIGFSHFISLGNGLDVDFGDLLNYLGSDPQTDGILLYIESISEARKFMSAARATARNKPVIVIKAGRMAEGARAAASHTGAMTGSDEVFDSAIRRAGMLRVDSIEDLFAAVETLARARKISGNRLAILTNGGGPGVLATDSLVRQGGKLAELDPDTLRELNQCLPATWSQNNPVDIIGDGDAQRYVRALRALLKDPNYDAILVMMVPVSVIDNAEVAQAVIREIRETTRPVLTCWMGADSVAEARKLFEKAGIPNYQTPEAAVNAFLQMFEYQDNQKSLMQTPPSIPEHFQYDADTVKTVIAAALAEGREILTETEAKTVLKAYAIPVVPTHIAKTVEEGVSLAESIGYPVALKIHSPEITHKSDMGGVLLNIESSDQLRFSAEGMLRRIERAAPEAKVLGFTVQKMIQRGSALELIIGATTDPIFGPTILFGQGGTSVEVVNDKAVALPPLNMNLARDLIAHTRVSRLMQGYRNIPPVNVHALQLALIKTSQLIVDHPQIEELDINPVFADAEGILALDARIRATDPRGGQTERLAIRPYPKQEEEWVRLKNGQRVLLRPIQPEDEPAHHDFLNRLTPQDRYYRFFKSIDDMTHSTLARFTQIDYDREMAFIAVGKNTRGENETWGVARAIADADHTEAEFAIVVRSDLHGIGLGHQLLEKLIRYCRQRGIERLVGQSLQENQSIRRLAEKFQFRSSLQDGIICYELNL
jgi:acetyltransferase